MTPDRLQQPPPAPRRSPGSAHDSLVGRAMRTLLFGLALAFSAAAAPGANDHASVTPSEPTPHEGCLEDVDPEGSGFTPGELRQAASLHKRANRTVDLDRATVLTAIALAQAYNLTLDVATLANVTTERMVVCSFSSLATVEGREALLGPLVGRGTGPLHLGESRLLTVFRTTTVQSVTLDRETAFAAIALKGAGNPVTLEDVLTYHRESSTTRTLERLVNITDEQLLLEIALREEKLREADERAEREARLRTPPAAAAREEPAVELPENRAVTQEPAADALETLAPAASSPADAAVEPAPDIEDAGFTDEPATDARRSLALQMLG